MADRSSRSDRDPPESREVTPLSNVTCQNPETSSPLAVTCLPSLLRHHGHVGTDGHRTKSRVVEDHDLAIRIAHEVRERQFGLHIRIESAVPDAGFIPARDRPPLGAGQSGCPMPSSSDRPFTPHARWGLPPPILVTITAGDDKTRLRQPSLRRYLTKYPTISWIYSRFGESGSESAAP